MRESGVSVHYDRVLADRVAMALGRRVCVSIEVSPRRVPELHGTRGYPSPQLHDTWPAVNTTLPTSTWLAGLARWLLQCCSPRGLALWRSDCVPLLLSERERNRDALVLCLFSETVGTCDAGWTCGARWQACIHVPQYSVPRLEIPQYLRPGIQKVADSLLHCCMALHVRQHFSTLEGRVCTVDGTWPLRCLDWGCAAVVVGGGWWVVMGGCWQTLTAAPDGSGHGRAAPPYTVRYRSADTCTFMFGSILPYPTASPRSPRALKLRLRKKAPNARSS